MYSQISCDFYTESCMLPLSKSHKTSSDCHKKELSVQFPFYIPLFSYLCYSKEVPKYDIEQQFI